MLNVKIKRLSPNAVIPTYAKDGDAGQDLTAISRVYDNDGNVVYGTGLAFEIPKGYVGLLFPRSSNAKQDLILSNSVGVLDSGYRGEVLFKFKPSGRFFTKLMNLIKFPVSGRHKSYEVGDRIGQIIILPIPLVQFEEVEELSDSERGTGGYGSTGRGNEARKEGFYPIKKGDKFLCIKDFVMDIGDTAYTKGKEYISEYDECVTNNDGNTRHFHTEEGDLYKYLIKVK